MDELGIGEIYLDASDEYFGFAVIEDNFGEQRFSLWYFEVKVSLSFSISFLFVVVLFSLNKTLSMHNFVLLHFIIITIYLHSFSSYIILR